MYAAPAPIPEKPYGAKVDQSDPQLAHVHILEAQPDHKQHHRNFDDDDRGVKACALFDPDRQGSQ